MFNVMDLVGKTAPRWIRLFSARNIAIPVRPMREGDKGGLETVNTDLSPLV